MQTDRWYLERRIYLAVGINLTIASVLSLVHSPWWLLFPGFVGAAMVWFRHDRLLHHGQWPLLDWVPSRAWHRSRAQPSPRPPRFSTPRPETSVSFRGPPPFN